MTIELALIQIANALEKIAARLPETITKEPANVPVTPAPIPPAPAPVVPVATPAPAPVVPAPAPIPVVPAVPTGCPFSDAKGMITYVMDSYKSMGPEKGALIQGVLTKLGVNNINDVKPQDYPALYSGIEGLKK